MTLYPVKILPFPLLYVPYPATYSTQWVSLYLDEPDRTPKLVQVSTSNHEFAERLLLKYTMHPTNRYSDYYVPVLFEMDREEMEQRCKTASRKILMDGLLRRNGYAAHLEIMLCSSDVWVDERTQRELIRASPGYALYNAAKDSLQIQMWLSIDDLTRATWRNVQRVHQQALQESGRPAGHYIGLCAQNPFLDAELVVQEGIFTIFRANVTFWSTGLIRPITPHGCGKRT